MKVSSSASVLCFSLVALASSDDVARIRREQRIPRGHHAADSEFMEEVAADQDAAFWERQLGGSNGKGKGGSKSKGKGGSKSKGSKSHRVLLESTDSPETEFMKEHAADLQDEIEFWNRELGGSNGKGKGKGGSKSKSSKGSRRVLLKMADTPETAFMQEHTAEVQEDIEFWNRELRGSYGRTGNSKSKGSKGSKGKGKGKGGSKSR